MKENINFWKLLYFNFYNCSNSLRCKHLKLRAADNKYIFLGRIPEFSFFITLNFICFYLFQLVFTDPIIKI